MQKIRTLLIDDEALALQDVAYLMEDVEDFELVGMAQSLTEAQKMIEMYLPDLLLLDIQLGEQTAFDLLENLEQSPEVIFMTAYNHYALQAFEANALDYLLKPIEPERLGKALEKVRQFLQGKPQTHHPSPQLNTQSKVFIKDGENCFFVTVEDIFLIESVGNYARVFFKNKMPFLKKSLNQLEQRLPIDSFFRINRYQIINLNHIQEINLSFKNRLLVKIGAQNIEVEVSARQSVRFKELMSL